ncbi:hypothetical protein GBAR_LOCUS20927, partial [Geodia barretti]
MVAWNQAETRLLVYGETYSVDFTPTRVEGRGTHECWTAGRRSRSGVSEPRQICNLIGRMSVTRERSGIDDVPSSLVALQQ